MDKTQDKISTYAANLSVKDITPQALHAVKRSLVDSIGCALGAFSADTAQVVRRVASRVSSTTPATLIGTSTKTSPDLAAFANGTMVRYLDYSDDYVKKDGPHPSDSLPAVLATAESLHADGMTFACGLTLAYEIIDRLVDSADFMFRGYDYAPEHSIGSALGCGKVMGLSKVQMGHALSLAIVPNIALGQTRKGHVSMWKACAGPNAARNGLFAAMLASEGLAGPNDPIEGPFGLMNKVTGPFELRPFGGNGRPFEIEETFFKYRQVVYSALLPVEIAIELHGKVDIDNIESITIFLHRRPVGTKESPEDPEKWDPKTRETADHSVPYCVVAALADGQITRDTFAPEHFRSPRLLALLKKVQVREDPEYSRVFYDTEVTAEYHARLEIVEKSGKKTVQHKMNPKGHPGNPMSDAEINSKFMELTAAALEPAQAKAALDIMWHLEDVKDMGQIPESVVIRKH